MFYGHGAIELASMVRVSQPII